MVPYIPQEVGMKQEGTSSDCRPLHLLFGPAIALSPPPSSHSRARRLVPRQTQSVLSVGMPSLLSMIGYVPPVTLLFYKLGVGEFPVGENNK